MRTGFAGEMGGCRVLCQVWGGWWRGTGVGSARQVAGFGTEARRQLQPRGSSKSKRSGSLGNQPFPGLLHPENLSREELVHVLRASVVDQKGPLVTLNKPQGIPVTGKPGELTLFSVLPELSQSLGLGEQELQIVRASGKETSGLVLLSSCPQTASRLQKFFAYSRRAQRPTATYWAVTDGIPATSEGKIQAALKLEYVDGVGFGLIPQAVPVKSPSRKDILEGVKKTLSHFRVVATGPGCALVHLQPVTGSPLVKVEMARAPAAPGFHTSPAPVQHPIRKEHVLYPVALAINSGLPLFMGESHRPVFPSQLQIHMVLQLCPVLGDHQYSARVGTVLGQRFLLPAESTKPQKQVLDEALLRRLHLTPAQVAQMPLHLHLHCLHLPGPRPRDAPIELLAPLPSYFSRTLQCLGLRQQ